MTQLFEKPAHELAAMIRGKDVSSREVVQAHLDRIDQVNGDVNAVVVVMADEALAAADKADASEPTGPFHGVPFTIKENIDFDGKPTTNGVPAFAGAMPVRDAPVVARMKAAGAVPIGRTNMPEMGLRLSTDNPLRGRTLNPWNKDLTAGGSSGGDGVALATGMTPFGLGNDIGGSLRNPAYCNGITSLKPTAGRIPHVLSIDPQDGGMAVQAMLVEEPMTRSVTDLKIGLQVLAGRDGRDPVSVDVPLQGAPAPKKAALVTEIPGGPIPAATIAEIERAGEILTAAGWQVDHAQPPELARVSEVWGFVLAADFSVLLPVLEHILTPPLHTVIGQLCEEFSPSKITSPELHSERSRLSRLWTEFFDSYPVVIGPTWACTPWPADADLDPNTGLQTVEDTVRFITPGNALGLPSVALPTGVADGLPTGIQIYADRWREDLCLEAAGIVEAGVTCPTPIDPK